VHFTSFSQASILTRHLPSSPLLHIPALRRWSPVHTTGQCPPPLAYHSALVIGTRMLVFGGINGATKANSNTTWALALGLLSLSG